MIITGWGCLWLLLSAFAVTCRADTGPIKASTFFHVHETCVRKRLDFYLNDAHSLVEVGMATLEQLAVATDFSVTRTDNLARNAALMFGTRHRELAESGGWNAADRTKLDNAYKNLGELQHFLKISPQSPRYFVGCGAEAYTKAYFLRQIDSTQPYVLMVESWLQVPFVHYSPEGTTGQQRRVKVPRMGRENDDLCQPGDFAITLRGSASFAPQLVLCDLFFQHPRDHIRGVLGMEEPGVRNLGDFPFAAGMLLHELLHIANYEKFVDTRFTVSNAPRQVDEGSWQKPYSAPTIKMLAQEQARPATKPPRFITEPAHRLKQLSELDREAALEQMNEFAKLHLKVDTSLYPDAFMYFCIASLFPDIIWVPTPDKSVPELRAMLGIQAGG